MLAWLLICLALGQVPDSSRSYFEGLARPRADSVRLERRGGPVIVIVVDALRPDHLSAYGYSRQTSPNLARLADEGVILTNYFTNANWTRPTTATMLTGLLPGTHGVQRERDRMGSQAQTLAEILAQHNVETGAVIGNGNAGSAFGLQRGFSYFADTVSHWQGLPSAAQVTELGLGFVRKHAEKPFFLLLFLVDTHDPYHAPAPYEEMFVSDPSVPLVRSPHWELGRYTPAQIERIKATYDGAVRYVDEVLGDLFSQLKSLGVYDRATIIVTADHGEAFGEHNVFLHSHHLYDELIRAPVIVRAPGMSVRGAYNHHLFSSVDWLPTLVGYFGATASRSLPGVDLFAQLAGAQAPDPDRYVISEFCNFGIKRRMIRTYRHKIIWQQPADEVEFMATVGRRSLLPSVLFDREAFQLFDVAEDPFERQDLFKPGILDQGPWNELMAKLRRYAAGPRAASEAVPVEELDEETRDDLRSLGYIR